MLGSSVQGVSRVRAGSSNPRTGTRAARQVSIAPEFMADASMTGFLVRWPGLDVDIVRCSQVTQEDIVPREASFTVGAQNSPAPGRVKMSEAVSTQMAGAIKCPPALVAAQCRRRRLS